METTSPMTKLKNESDAIILQDLLSLSQTNIIHRTLEYFSILLKDKESLSKKQAEIIWINDITKIKSKTSEKILEKLQNLVRRNYMENFALEKALIDTSIEGDQLCTRLRNILDKNPGVCLKERVSIVVSEILQILSTSQKQAVNKEALRYQIDKKTDIDQFVWKVQVYQKRIKEENGSFFSLILAPLGFFGLSSFKYLDQKKHSDHKTLQGNEYSKLEMREKKDL